MFTEHQARQKNNMKLNASLRWTDVATDRGGEDNFEYFIILVNPIAKEDTLQIASYID